MARIGIDTNVLVRLLVKDDENQMALAENLIRKLGTDDVLFINVIVLIETLWTLRRQYGYRSTQLLSLVQALMERSDLDVDEYEIVGNALRRSRTPGVDISDALIGELNKLRGCDVTFTFDAKAAKRIPGMELLT
jgi:predicted nucleic-acid-binding protein